MPERPPQRHFQRPLQRRKIITDANMFDVDMSQKPEGMSYAWRRVSLAGQEDVRRQVVSETNGWTPVPASRHPELMGTRGGDEPIILGGQMLMEIPEQWETEMRSIDEFSARYTLEETMQRLNGDNKRRGAGKGVTRHAANVSELIE
jgi:hypothetical protein